MAVGALRGREFERISGYWMPKDHDKRKVCPQWAASDINQ